MSNKVNLYLTRNWNLKDLKTLTAHSKISMEQHGSTYYIYQRIDNYKKPVELFKTKNWNKLQAEYHKLIESKS